MYQVDILVALEKNLNDLGSDARQNGDVTVSIVTVAFEQLLTRKQTQVLSVLTRHVQWVRERGSKYNGLTCPNKATSSTIMSWHYT